MKKLPGKVASLLLVLIMVLSGFAMLSAITQPAAGTGILTVTISSNINPADAYQTIYFNATASFPAGDGTYGFYYKVLGSSGSMTLAQNTTSPTWETDFTGADTYLVKVVAVQTSDVAQGSAEMNETVDPQLTVSASTSKNPIDAGMSVTFTASVSGGASPYSYQWYLNNSAVSGATSSTWTTTTLPTGSPTVYVKVKDSNSYVVQSNVITETVHPDTTVSIISSVSVIDEGMQANFTATATGGSGTYTAYQWYLNGSAVSGATNSTWTTTTLPTGSPTVYVTVTDSDSYIAQSNTISVTVNPPLEVSISSSVNPSDYGEAVTFSSVVTGGTPPYYYQWSAMGVNVSGATGPTWTTSTLPVGQDPIRLWVTDSAGDPAPGWPSAAIPRIVLAGDYVSGKGNYIPNTTYIGDNFNVSIAQIGASSHEGMSYGSWLANYSFQWYKNSIEIPGATKPYLSTFENSPGNYLFSVRIVNLTNASGVYQGVWWGNWSETVLPNVLPPDSVEFIEQGLPNGTFWSANIVIPYGNGFSTINGMDGYYTLVRGNSIPSVILTPGNGTWHYEIADYLRSSNGMLMTPGAFVPNITEGNVTLPADSANGSVIIYISFVPIANTQPNSAISVTHTYSLSTVIAFSTVKDSALQGKILPIASKGPTAPVVLTKTSVSPASKSTSNFISFIFISLIAISAIVSALTIRRVSRKKQRDKEVMR